MKLKKTIYGIIAASMIVTIATGVNFNPYTAQASTKTKVESILEHTWMTKPKKYSKPVNVGMDPNNPQYAYYYAHTIGGGKNNGYRINNVDLSKHKKIVSFSQNDQNGYGDFKFTKLGNGYYMVTSLGVIYTGANLNHKKVGGYTLFIKKHGHKKITVAQKYTGMGKTYPYNYDKKHTYYRR